MEGRQVSHYRILKRLGAGGMGVVYQAEDSRLKRTVALKFLPPELTRDQSARERFIQEAQAASALDHPNICAIYDVDSVDEQLFIAMAYYEGETLRDRIARGPLAVAEAIDFAQQIARGLDHAHQAGIVHRDIKPANVIVTRGGMVKIVDFGIAKILDRTGPTQTGTTLGTVAYMAPEQVHGYTVDHRADLWALGVVLYEMLTGRQPFGGDRDLAILHNILHETPPAARSLRPDLPPAIEPVLAKALAKDRERRYQSAHEMVDALATFVPMTGTMTAPIAPAPSGSRRLVAVAAIVALLTAAGTAAWFMRRGLTANRVDELIGQSTRLADRDRNSEALAALEDAERRAPGDPRLRDLSARIAETRDVVIEPAGATVSIRPYDQPSQAWRVLGQTPIKAVRIPREFLRWKIELSGYETLEVLGAYNRTFAPLTAAGKIPAGHVGDPAGADEPAARRVQLPGPGAGRRVRRRQVRGHQQAIQSLRRRRRLHETRILVGPLRERRTHAHLGSGDGGVSRSHGPPRSVDVGSRDVSGRAGRLSGHRRELVRSRRVREVFRPQPADYLSLGPCRKRRLGGVHHPVQQSEWQGAGPRRLSCGGELGRRDGHGRQCQGVVRQHRHRH